MSAGIIYLHGLNFVSIKRVTQSSLQCSYQSDNYVPKPYSKQLHQLEDLNSYQHNIIVCNLGEKNASQNYYVLSAVCSIH